MRLLAKLGLAAMATVALLPLTSSAPANNHRNHKITICHIPPGNPANAHSITVSINALDAHLAHGDFVGSCNGTPPPPPPPPPPTDPGDGGGEWAPM